MAAVDAPGEILALVGKFALNAEQYKAPSFNETQLRVEFLNPFFEALGWDVTNKAGWAEAYRQVVHEDAIKVGDSTKAPDYAFRVGGRRKFFVEAKKPAVNIENDPAPAFQLRRYAWSAGLPLSILTDFEEFAVYDTRIKPKEGDKAATARILLVKYDEYEKRWDEIAAIFSQEAVLKGSFDKYAGSAKKKGTATVDEAFLDQIEAWREKLAKNLALRNESLTVRELNEAVQKTIDRIVFLRICEGRAIEPAGGNLQSLLNGDGVYGKLCEVFRRADEKYNSGLFHFRKEKERPEPPDSFTLGLSIDDKVLKEIIAELYYPRSDFEYAILPVEILGQVYEQFLGKVIRLTAGHQAKVEEKPEVKKAGGVYYTPKYIVDYIVKNTVGKLLEGKNPKSAVGLKILDPACGSGSFLLGAYQFLLDWHLRWHAENDPEKWAAGKSPAIFKGPGGSWRLTAAKKKEILLNNLHGVDIDPQAVEVTKLSLLLQVLEGESAETITAQRRLFHDRALPDLSRNIKCGNSLIEPSDLGGQLLRDNDLYDQLNPFDWKREYPDIMKRGGFDVVIGNPPYVRQESLSEMKELFSKKYESFDGMADLYTYFIELGIKLLGPNGFFGIIVSSSFLRASYGEALRKTITRHATIRSIVDFGGLAVFENAKDTYVCIPILQRSSDKADTVIRNVKILNFANLETHLEGKEFMLPAAKFGNDPWVLRSERDTITFDKIKTHGVALVSYVDKKIYYGIKTGLNEAFLIDSKQREKLIQDDPGCKMIIKPAIGGEDIRRYYIDPDDCWIIFTRRGIQLSAYPSVRKHLEAWKAELTPKKSKDAVVGRKPGSYDWYEIQDDVAYYEAFDRVKIVYPDIAKYPRFCLDTDGNYLLNTAYCIGSDDRYLLGILNSRLFWYAIGHISIPFGVRAGEFRYRLIYQYMEKVPIHVVDEKDKKERDARDNIIALVNAQLASHKKLPDVKSPREKESLERQIAATDAEIDRLVYQLYGLTEEEIKIVEGIL